MISLSIAQLAVRAVSIPPENSMTIYLGDFGEAIESNCFSKSAGTISMGV
jgi:hypothetical protein